MKKVEQVDAHGNVVLAQDEILSRKEIQVLLRKYMTSLSGDGPFYAIIGGRKILLCVKNVTYLGHPHPLHKKRVQIPSTWKSVLRKKNAFLFGIYSYKGGHIFVLFDTRLYKHNNLNNSSAHVHTIDLQSALRYGVFQKTDERGNMITVCTEKNFPDVLRRVSLKGDTPTIHPTLLSPPLQMIDDFASGIEREWKGVPSYRGMILAKFPDAFQPEWPGFFLEYSFSSFLDKNPIRKKICMYQKVKGRGGLDFDLRFEGYLGDLKMHDVSSGSVPGNDLESVNKAIKEYSRLWYVIVTHTSIKDKNKGYVVTKFWNQELMARDGTQKDLHSYGEKMKYSVRLNEILVTEIHEGNKSHLSVLKQGKNSNGKVRNHKIQILKKNLENFVIYRKIFS